MELNHRDVRSHNPDRSTLAKIHFDLKRFWNYTVDSRFSLSGQVGIRFN
ncbi:hypothetical protein FRUB_07692 [Fimbriiglobus ruber]|uniref:Uncharacterized protein n=1 Tax=Fimbriiglobus ruber TaxID=1908690 RepID=A0A225DAT4_9BACT|nr:hypothetical protein FRUB_07692 [Fimbriiglobus ruber]